MRYFTLLLLLACTADPAQSQNPPSAPNEEDPTDRVDTPTAADPKVDPVVREEVAPPTPTGFDIAADLFTDGVMPEFDVELSDAALASLRLDPITWVEAALVYRGVRYEPIGVRLKGSHSFRTIDEKPALKISLNKFVPGRDLFGIDELTLNNMVTDPTMMAERLAYRMFREMGLPASRANHALVRINGESRGLYMLLETLDDEFLALRYADPSGSLFEVSNADFTWEYLDQFEPESGPGDLTGLQNIADAFATAGADVVAATDPWIDWTEIVDFNALTAVIGQHDSYPWHAPGDDAHIYFDPADGKMEMLPHGMDETFQDRDYDILGGPGLLLTSCLATPDCAADYVASVWEVQATIERIDLVGYARDVQAEIAPWAVAEPGGLFTTLEIADGQETLFRYIETRPEYLAEQIGAP